MNIGKKIQQIRKDKGLSLDQLAERSGLAKATLSKIENGHTVSGAMKTHLKIARGLGISMAELYLELDQEEKEVLPLEPSAEEAPMKSYAFDETSYYTILTQGNIFKYKMLPGVYTIEPGGSTCPKDRPAEQKPYGTERVCLVVEGIVEAVIDGEPQTPVKSKGGVFYIKADKPHYFNNKGEVRAKIFCVTCPAVL